MLNIIINKKANKITIFTFDSSITWMPLDKYKFNANEDYTVLEQDDCLIGFNKPRVVKGSFLIALLKNLKK